MAHSGTAQLQKTGSQKEEKNPREQPDGYSPRHRISARMPCADKASGRRHIARRFMRKNDSAHQMCSTDISPVSLLRMADMFLKICIRNLSASWHKGAQNCERASKLFRDQVLCRRNRAQEKKHELKYCGTYRSLQGLPTHENCSYPDLLHDSTMLLVLYKGSTSLALQPTSLPCTARLTYHKLLCPLSLLRRSAFSNAIRSLAGR